MDIFYYNILLCKENTLKMLMFVGGQGADSVINFPQVRTFFENPILTNTAQSQTPRRITLRGVSKLNFLKIQKLLTLHGVGLCAD